ncbi:MAG: aldo/keto reductase [Vulcanimicrobiota bacterium]
MEYRTLGKTGIVVSLLSLGTLTMGPCQANLPVSEGASLIKDALSLGCNLIDTAELYDTYPYIKKALEGADAGVMIASRSYAVTEEEMESSFRKASEEMGRLTVDIFMLHQTEGPHTLKGHRAALLHLCSLKRKGLIKAVGISTHHIAAVKAASLMDEIDVIFAILNRSGLGIQDGSRDEMVDALARSFDLGKGIMVMKPLGGGHLITDVEDSLQFLLQLPFISTITVGVQNTAELVMNHHILHGLKVPAEIRERISAKKRRLHIEDCQRCGKCIDACPSKALRMGDDGCTVDEDRCLLCGYCAVQCPEFCIKVL